MQKGLIHSVNAESKSFIGSKPGFYIEINTVHNIGTELETSMFSHKIMIESLCKANY